MKQRQEKRIKGQETATQAGAGREMIGSQWVTPLALAEQSGTDHGFLSVKGAIVLRGMSVRESNCF